MLDDYTKRFVQIFCTEKKVSRGMWRQVIPSKKLFRSG